MQAIVVTEYDPGWPLIFEQLRAYLWPAVADIAVAIEHVGSTSVVGLAAKPIIDLDIIVPSAADIPTAIARLSALGYQHLGDRGIAGREAFRQQNDMPPHHLYLCPADSVALHNHLAVRDYLRSHPEAIQAYSELKKHLAATFPDNIDRYVDGKTDLILSMLQHAELSAEQLAAIERANRLP